MKYLVNPNREGGFPLVGESLEIISTDMQKYINSILDSIVPRKTAVLLSKTTSFSSEDFNVRFIYVKKNVDNGEIYELSSDVPTPHNQYVGNYCNITITNDMRSDYDANGNLTETRNYPVVAAISIVNSNDVNVIQNTDCFVYESLEAFIDSRIQTLINQALNNGN